MTKHKWLEDIRSMVGRKYGRVYAWDKINAAMIRQWCEVMGVDNPIYTDEEFARKSTHGELVAPPAMLQAWCLAGFNDVLAPGSTDEDPYGSLKLLEEQGYPAVVAVNCNLHFERYLTVGERLYYTTIFDDITDEKTTALGTGFFVTLKMVFYSQAQDSNTSEDEKVGEMLFRVFKFKPAKKPEQSSSQDSNSGVPKILRPKPGISDDNRFFWEGCEQNELRVQQCNSCNKLQHPPAPACIHCHSFDLGYKVASGKGELYSFVVMHHPYVPPFDNPNPIGLIELEEGIRISAGLVGVDDTDSLKIGEKVEVEFHKFEGDLTLPQFRLVTNEEV